MTSAPPAPGGRAKPERFYHDYIDDDDAREAEDELLKQRASDGALFEDDVFFGAAALYRDVLRPPPLSIPPERVRWRRICERGVQGMQNPTLFGGRDGAPGSVEQGAIADCWFLSALAVLAGSRERVEALFVSRRNAARGVYTLKFWKRGAWRYVHIDDRVPCGRSGAPLGARSADVDETWPVLVEKAYAKLHGSYEALAASQGGGRTDRALEDLTGSRCVRMRLGDAVVQQDIAEDGGASLFGRLRDLLEGEDGTEEAGAPHRRRLVGCAFSSSARTGSGSAPEDKDTSLGILGAHAYGVVRLAEVRAPPPPGSDAAERGGGEDVVLRLVQVRSVWGILKWRGDWCDDDALWDDYPKAARELLPGAGAARQAGESGAEAREVSAGARFWLSWADFLDQFNLLFVCEPPLRKDWDERTFPGVWAVGEGFEGSAPGGGPADGTFDANPQFALTVDTPTDLRIWLTQEDPRMAEGTLRVGRDRRPPETRRSLRRGEPPDAEAAAAAAEEGAGYGASWIGVVVARVTEGKSRLHRFQKEKVEAISAFCADRSVFLETLEPLEEGKYVVIPCLVLPHHAQRKRVEGATSKSVDSGVSSRVQPQRGVVDARGVGSGAGGDAGAHRGGARQRVRRGRS
jgi:hypothetical protein